MDTLDSRFIAARRRYIASQFAQLNDMQQQAVLTTEGPLLLLAGAGSGKTTVLINRIANLIRFGSGSDSDLVPAELSEEEVKFLEQFPENPSERDRARAEYLCGVEPANPWSIIAITFTNKAATELKERLAAQLGPKAQDIWAMTFHSACCRILRRDIDSMGYTRSFTIYDSSDSERVMKDILKELDMDEKTFPPKYVLGAISKEKDKMVTPEEMLASAEKGGNLKAKYIAKAYARYQKQLKENNALDFDDIICVTVRLLQENEEVRRYYQRKFRYVLVDEYQDTNHAQYLLTSLLAGGYENICVVGDDDQSIYRFRGATIENILSFEKQFRGARLIRLEQNYRSTQSILDTANAVISHNLGRKGKQLWTANGRGEPITVYEAGDESDEANFVAGRILKQGGSMKDYAILYRTNAQSNALEYAMKRHGIPYRVIGGTRFFDRAEVKDILSYLSVINNRSDTLRLRRIINNPARGLGAKTLETADRLAQAEGKPLYSVVSDPYSYAPLQKAAAKFMKFTVMIEELAQMLEDGMSLLDFYDELLERTGYVEALTAKDSEENKTRLENVRELKSSIYTYMENTDADHQPTLAGFLEEIALYTDIEQLNAGDEAVVMMTMHSAKGLEFPHVFLVGLEDGLFPGMRAIGDDAEMEEERRLCYVAITRAKKTLTVSHARQRMIYGKTSAALPSRFLREFPAQCLEKKGGFRPAAEPVSYAPSYSGGVARPMRKPIASESSLLRSNSQPMLELNRGDMVEHKSFGRGMVLTVTKMGGDALLEIAFDNTGTRKLMAKTASACMKKL